MSVVLRLENISKWFKHKQALKQISFEVNSGKILGILGPNAAGKSTTIRIIMGILMPDEGKVYYTGHHGTSIPRHIIGFMPEERGIERIERDGNKTIVHLKDNVHPSVFIRDFPEHLRWSELHIDRKSLHDIFVSIAKGGSDG